mmetsp:Transcript_5783/g.5371  ORF Transcript_5783/g.5371 Transcript_5783/m.5371 type:complete len:104 (-) Transcript_5783:3-314(-)
MLVSIGYTTYTGWVYAATSSGRGWLPMGTLDLLFGDPYRCPFTRIANAMVYPQPECEDTLKDGDDDEISSSSSDDDEKDNDDDDSDFAAPNNYFDNPEPAPSS